MGIARGEKARAAEARFAVSGEIVSRAIERGELPEAVLARAALELGAAPLYYHILALGEAMDDLAIKDLASWVSRQDLKNFPDPENMRER